MATNNCPCGSPTPYEACCGVYHQGSKKPLTAIALMKSRYAAYAKKEINYLLQTTHPGLDTVYEDLEAWANSTTWTRLEILTSSDGLAHQSNGRIEFKAYYLDQATKTHQHHEKSEFSKIDGQWYYSSGEINPETQPETKHTIGRNDPCPCGSGKKHKKCCA